MPTQTKNNDFSSESYGENAHVFTPAQHGDPEQGWAWCFTDDDAPRVGCNKVVHYIQDYGWLGHHNCILEAIPSDEAELFRLDLPGNVGRQGRITYQCLRLLSPESFIQMFLAPYFNREVRKHMREMRERAV